VIWRCEVKNGTVGWIEAEIVGSDFLTEFRKRFGHLRFRNVRQLDYYKNEWVPVNVEADAE